MSRHDTKPDFPIPTDIAQRGYDKVREQLILDMAYVLSIIATQNPALFWSLTSEQARGAFAQHTTRMRYLASQIDPDPLRYGGPQQAVDAAPVPPAEG